MSVCVHIIFPSFLLSLSSHIPWHFASYSNNLLDVHVLTPYTPNHSRHASLQRSGRRECVEKRGSRENERANRAYEQKRLRLVTKPYPRTKHRFDCLTNADWPISYLFGPWKSMSAPRATNTGDIPNRLTCPCKWSSQSAARLFLFTNGRLTLLRRFLPRLNIHTCDDVISRIA